mmetsp:Transcript_51930/g.57977  ORF Transcript_51930/g.57977 Transcript_51930/m.57977 type:complete len:83 (+) Transcript_51930:931-1179(+)
MTCQGKHRNYFHLLSPPSNKSLSSVPSPSESIEVLSRTVVSIEESSSKAVSIEILLPLLLPQLNESLVLNDTERIVDHPPSL